VVVHNKVILVVDDETEMLSLLEMLLKRQGYAVMKAQDASMALHLIKSLIPNLFIIDLMLPGMSGFELCEHIRMYSSTSKTPIVILTARADAESQARAFDVGADVYLHKSSLPNGLISEIRSLLSPDPGGNHSHGHFDSFS
jgi:DNA-binding response OmpR family regulator